EQRKIKELKEKLKHLQHQQSIAQAEKDGFQQQLEDLRRFYGQEAERKTKALDKAKAEIFSLLETEATIKKLLLNEYKEGLPSSPRMKGDTETLDLHSIQQLHQTFKSESSKSR